MRMRKSIVGLLALFAACGTETLELRTLPVTHPAQLAKPGTEAAYFVLARFDARYGHGGQSLYPVSIRLDGQYLVEHVDAIDRDELVGSGYRVEVPAGTSLVEIEDFDGKVVFSQSLTFEPGSHNQVALFGPTGTEKSLVILDALAGVEAGQTRVRFVNVTEENVPIDIVSCAASHRGCREGASCLEPGEKIAVDDQGNVLPPYDDALYCPADDIGTECTAMKKGLPYGEMFEVTVPTGTDVRALMPATVGSGVVDLPLRSDYWLDEPRFETVFANHVWEPGQFVGCVNYANGYFVDNWSRAVSEHPQLPSPSGWVPYGE
jgi:hypothetical protein